MTLTSLGERRISKKDDAGGNPSATPVYHWKATGRVAETQRLHEEAEKKRPGESGDTHYERVPAQRLVHQNRVGGIAPATAYGEPGFVFPQPIFFGSGSSSKVQTTKAAENSKSKGDVSRFPPSYEKWY